MGVFSHLTRFRIIPLNEELDIQSLLNREINFLLNVLPEGTEYLGAIEQTVSDLSIPFILRFKHPAFEDGSRFETNYARIFWRKEDGNIVEKNLFTGIRYFGSDGKQRY